MIGKRGAVAALVVAALVFAAGALTASAGTSRAGHSWPASIVGTWDVTLAIQGQPPGRVLATFMKDRTTIESANSRPALRGASHGVWQRRGQRLFSVTRVFFRFHPVTGNYDGTATVNATVGVASDGETFDAVSRTVLRDPDGNVVGPEIPGTATGTRMHVEPIPEQP
jgi:hypothetical protein